MKCNRYRIPLTIIPPRKRASREATGFDSLIKQSPGKVRSVSEGKPWEECYLLVKDRNARIVWREFGLFGKEIRQWRRRIHQKSDRRHKQNHTESVARNSAERELKPMQETSIASRPASQSTHSTAPRNEEDLLLKTIWWLWIGRTYYVRRETERMRMPCWGWKRQVEADKSELVDSVCWMRQAGGENGDDSHFWNYTKAK